MEDIFNVVWWVIPLIPVVLILAVEMGCFLRRSTKWRLCTSLENWFRNKKARTITLVFVCFIWLLILASTILESMNYLKEGEIVFFAVVGVTLALCYFIVYYGVVDPLIFKVSEKLFPGEYELDNNKRIRSVIKKSNA